MRPINPLSFDWFEHCEDYGDEHGTAVGLSVWMASIWLPVFVIAFVAHTLVFLFPLVVLGVLGSGLALLGSAWLGWHMVRAIRSYKREEE